MSHLTTGTDTIHVPILTRPESRVRRCARFCPAGRGIFGVQARTGAAARRLGASCVAIRAGLPVGMGESGVRELPGESCLPPVRATRSDDQRRAEVDRSVPAVGPHVARPWLDQPVDAQAVLGWLDTSQQPIF